MQGRVNYTAVGLFVIGLFIASLMIFFWLQLKKHDQTYDTYVVYLNEDVSGLSVDGAVRYNGVPVGFVKAIGLVPSNSQLVRVLIDVESETPVNVSTVATLMSQGITGVEYLGLTSDQVDAAPLKIHAGQEYPVIESKPSFLVQLSKVLPQLANNMSELSNSVGAVFDEKNRKALAETLQNTAQITTTLNNNSKALLTKMQATLDQTNNAFGSGRVMMNTVSQQILPATQQALQRLNAIEVNVQTLTDAMKRNPSVVIRGTQSRLPGPGEK